MGHACKQYGYTVWTLAVCSNHAHAIVRTHGDRSEVIWENLARDAMLALRGEKIVPPDHPVWLHRPYKVFLYSAADVIGRINYVNENPIKEGLAQQHWDFIKACPFLGK